jgi:hypothetical protein
MQQILKVFIILAFIIAVIAVPVQKRQECPDNSVESDQSDTFAVKSDPDSPSGVKPVTCP